MVRSQERENYLAGILTTMVETGYGWFEFKNYKWGSENGPATFGNEEYASVEARDTGEMRVAAGDEEFVEVTTNTVARGMSLLKSGKVHVGSHVIAQIHDEDIDSDGADCILQAAILGEIVYG